MGMVDSQSCFSNNQANMDGTGNEKEEEAEAPKLVPTCWGYPEAYSYSEANICTPEKSSSRNLVSCLQWRSVWRLIKSLTQFVPATVPGWRRRVTQSVPATIPGWRRRVFFLAWLKGRKIFGLCFLCLSYGVQDLGGILGSCRTQGFENVKERFF